ncbi:MAG: hypothetical protein IPN05_09650 [Sulfuritalea sp.]|nr:hypothetical protein [Sulfuritalea sp.]
MSISPVFGPSASPGVFDFGERLCGGVCGAQVALSVIDGSAHKVCGLLVFAQLPGGFVIDWRGRREFDKGAVGVRVP